MKADNCIALLQQMVAIPSESQNEQAFAEFLANYLREELSMETQLQHVDGKSYNVIGRWNSSTHGKKLILDEPGSSLDPLMRDRLCDRMRGYLDDGDGNRSIIFSTHNIADMENAADYAVFMDHGRLIEQGFIEELKEKYIVISGDAQDYEKAKPLLMSSSHNRTTFDGLALAEHSAELAEMGVESEAPTLQQLSVGLLKYAEGNR